MMLDPSRPPVKTGGGDTSILPDDLRIRAFADLVDAFDRADSRAGIRAVRELRRLGFSVCIISPARPIGGH